MEDDEEPLQRRRQRNGPSLLVRLFSLSFDLSRTHLSPSSSRSGTTLDAQQRYASGTLKILSNWLDNKPQTPSDLIVENGEYATKAYGQRGVGPKS